MHINLVNLYNVTKACTVQCFYRMKKRINFVFMHRGLESVSGYNIIVMKIGGHWCGLQVCFSLTIGGIFMPRVGSKVLYLDKVSYIIIGLSYVLLTMGPYYMGLFYVASLLCIRRSIRAAIDTVNSKLWRPHML